MTIQEGIERLAEINCANTFIDIGDELKNERQNIVNFLNDMKVIELDKKGFRFIGNDSDNNKKIYLDMFENF